MSYSKATAGPSDVFIPSCFISGPGVIRWTNSSCATSGSSRDGEASSGIIRHSGPAHPKYSTVEARMRTFKDWPPALRQQPADLSDAGFYYIGEILLNR